MTKRLKDALLPHWRLVAYVLLAIAIAVATLLTSGASAALAVIFTAGSAMLLGDAWQSRPKPQAEIVLADQLDLWPSDEIARMFARVAEKENDLPEERTLDKGVFGVLRPLDKSAVLEDAVARARASAPGSNLEAIMGFGMQHFAPPTNEVHELFSKQVDEYKDALRSWLDEVDEFMAARRCLLIAEVQLTNPAKVDAEDAGVVLSFPSDVEAVDEVPQLPAQPDAPTFPMRLSALSRAMGMGGINRWHDASPVLAPPIGSGLLERTVSIRRSPSYSRSVDVIEVRFPRGPIRHRESARAGDNLLLRCRNAGTLRVQWAINASNLPHPREGNQDLVYRPEDTGDPIKALGDLENFLDELAGEHRGNG